MWLTDEQLLYYQRCQRRSFLDVYGNLSWREPPSDFLQKLQRDSHTHRQNVLADRTYQQPNYPKRDWLSGSQATLELMQQGAEHIYKGVLLASIKDWELGIGEWELETPKEDAASSPLTSIANSQSQQIVLVSKPLLLIKQPGHSNFGDWIYIPAEIKFSRRPKPDYQIVAAFHAFVLAAFQGTLPETAWLILRSKKVYSLNLEIRMPRMQQILQECIQTLLSPNAPEVFISRQRCSFCGWYDRCYAIAKSQQHLSLLPGVTPSRYQYLQSLNLTTVEAIAAVNPTQLEPVFGNEVAVDLVRQAQATLQNRPLLNTTDLLNLQSDRHHLPSASVELYFDIEAEPELNLDYLLGVLVVDKLAKTQVFYPFLAETPAAEKLIWQQFLDLVSTYPNAPIFHFSPYEADTIKRLSKLYKTPISHVKPILARLVDMHEQVMDAVTLPIESYSLKSIASWMGFEWRDSQASGSKSIFWYDRWLKTGDRAFLDSILLYNEDDCRATYHVKDWLSNFLQI